MENDSSENCHCVHSHSLPEAQLFSKSQIALLKQDLAQLRIRNADLQNSLMWREMQIDWVARTFPEIMLPAELSSPPVKLVASRVATCEESRSSAPATKSTFTDILSLTTLKKTIRSHRKNLQRFKKEFSSQLQNLFEGSISSFHLLVATARKHELHYKDLWLREASRRRKLHEDLQTLRGSIRVYCRLRPIIGEHAVYPLDFERVALRDKEFYFDRVFSPESKTAEISMEIAPLVISALDGYPFCVFAFGQTGSGKTFSMEGIAGEQGLYEATFGEFFAVVRQRQLEGWSYTDISVSVIEIYNDEIRDLLSSSSKLILRQKPGGFLGPCGMTLMNVTSPREACEVLIRGSANRVVGSHNLNSRSSRSHLITQLRFKISLPAAKELLSGSVTLVDLAGSERIAKSGAEGDSAKEAIHINRSLLALGDVIHAKARRAAHVPYRNSVLTSLLQENLQGDAKTVMLLQINPSTAFADESASSLTFANRVSTADLKRNN